MTECICERERLFCFCIIAVTKIQALQVTFIIIMAKIVISAETKETSLVVTVEV
jgi:hypothetical protein